jgi:hypothetical protein
LPNFTTMVQTDTTESMQHGIVPSIDINWYIFHTGLIHVYCMCFILVVCEAAEHVAVPTRQKPRCKSCGHPMKGHKFVVGCTKNQNSSVE